MKVTSLTLSAILFACIWSTSIYAKRYSGMICDPRVPKVTVDEAIHLVREYYNSGRSAKKAIYIDYVELKCQDNKYKWYVGYRLKEYESGHIRAIVFMDGSVKRGGTTKDG